MNLSNLQYMSNVSSLNGDTRFYFVVIQSLRNMKHFTDDFTNDIYTQLN